MSINVRPEGWEPPAWGRQPRPEVLVALDNPGLWIECDWDQRDWAQPDSNISQRRKRLNEQWDVRKSAKHSKVWLRYRGLSDD